LIADSKFKDMPSYATLSRGHLALQDHDEAVYFRNLKIRDLAPAQAAAVSR
jgi:cytochrome c